jgi:hypothetical protein
MMIAKRSPYTGFLRAGVLGLRRCEVCEKKGGLVGHSSGAVQLTDPSFCSWHWKLWELHLNVSKSLLKTLRGTLAPLSTTSLSSFLSFSFFSFSFLPSFLPPFFLWHYWGLNQCLPWINVFLGSHHCQGSLLPSGQSKSMNWHRHTPK